jgi:hypothetical protein
MAWILTVRLQQAVESALAVSASIYAVDMSAINIGGTSNRQSASLQGSLRKQEAICFPRRPALRMLFQYR